MNKKKLDEQVQAQAIKFSKRLYILRVEKGWSQAETARKVGIPHANFTMYESLKYKSLPGFRHLVKLASGFRVSADFLLGLKDA